MKYIIAAVLSAILIQLSPAHINNSVAQPVTNKTVGQSASKLTTTPPEPTSNVAVTPKVEPQPQPTPAPKPVAVATPPTDRQLLMQQAGIPRADWNAVDYIVSHESSWRPTATNSSSGAHGLCQALPASKMASAGKDYMTNPVTQLRWCHHYAMNRYSSWWSAHAFWQSNRWW